MFVPDLFFGAAALFLFFMESILDIFDGIVYNEVMESILYMIPKGMMA